MAILQDSYNVGIAVIRLFPRQPGTVARKRAYLLHLHLFVFYFFPALSPHPLKTLSAFHFYCVS